MTAKPGKQRQAELKARRALQGLKRRSVYATDAEWLWLKARLAHLRELNPCTAPDAASH